MVGKNWVVSQLLVILIHFHRFTKKYRRSYRNLSHREPPPSAHRANTCKRKKPCVSNLTRPCSSHSVLKTLLVTSSVLLLHTDRRHSVTKTHSRSLALKKAAKTSSLRDIPGARAPPLNIVLLSGSLLS